MRGLSIRHLMYAVAASALLFEAVRLDQSVTRCTPISPLLAVLYLCGALGFYGARWRGRPARMGLWLGLLLGPIGVIFACSRPVPEGWPERRAKEDGPAAASPEVLARLPEEMAKRTTAVVAVVVATLSMSCADRVPSQSLSGGRAGVVKTDGPPPVVWKPTPWKDDTGSSVSTRSADHDVVATISDDGRSIRLSLDGREGFATIGFSPMAGRVIEMRICPWTPWSDPGVALAIKTRNIETGMFSYHWATHRHYYESGRAHGVFLESKVDYRLVTVVNPPTEGDSIYIILEMSRQTEAGWERDGYVYKNGCPVSSGMGGRLYHLPSTPEKQPSVVDPLDAPPSERMESGGGATSEMMGDPDRSDSR